MDDITRVESAEIAIYDMMMFLYQACIMDSNLSNVASKEYVVKKTLEAIKEFSDVNSENVHVEVKDDVFALRSIHSSLDSLLQTKNIDPQMKYHLDNVKFNLNRVLKVKEG